MKIDQAFPSKYVTSGDFKHQGAVTVTIRGMAIEDVGDGETKPVLYFSEAKKGMVLNVTNARIIAQVLGDDETDNWVGQQITLGVTSVPFQGKLVDAIRVQQPIAVAAPAASSGLDTGAAF